MSLVLQSSGGGQITIQEPATASNFTQTLPAASGEVVVTGANSAIVSGTAVASTSGTSIDFTGIPSWVKRITVMFNSVSTNGTSAIQMQLGSGSFTTSGYLGSGLNVASTFVPAGANSSSGLLLMSGSSAAAVYQGFSTISLITGNSWCQNGILGRSDTAAVAWSGNFINLSNTLDRVRITTVNGTDTFDAGSINILYE
jgi:hypothetical protein